MSVVIPLFNKERWITETLLSVHSQTYSNWECLIINDGSTDQSLEIVNKFILSHPGNWRIITQVNKGQTLARNLGIKKSKGEYIAFLDADDLWLPDKLKLQLETHLLNPDISLSLTSYVIFKKNQKSGFRIVSYHDAKKMMSGWLSMTGFGGLIESTGFIKKKTLDEFGQYSESFSMTSGLDLYLRIASKLKVVILRDPLVLYRLSPGQFHKREDVLIKDLEIMRVKYTQGRGDYDRLRGLHSSYFFWSKCRSQGGGYFGVIGIKTILLFRRKDLPMLYHLLSRNFVALIRGFLQQRKIRTFLESFHVG